MENISDHITYAEGVKSQDAIRNNIDNTPTPKQLANMKLVAVHCFEPLRKWYGKPIGISSFLRRVLLNKHLRGSATSGHCAGESTGKEEAAIDIDADIFNNGITNKEIFLWLYEHVEFNELIWEFGDENNPAWVHVMYRVGDNNKEVLRAIKGADGKTKYIPFDL